MHVRIPRPHTPRWVATHFVQGVNLRNLGLFFIGISMFLGMLLLIHVTNTTTQERDRAISGWDAERAANRTERIESTKKDQELLAFVRDVERKYNAFVDLHGALIDWLQLRGIYPPENLIGPENSSSESSEEHDARKQREQNQERKRPGSGTNNSGPDGPGNSVSNGGGSSSGSGKDHGGGNDKDGKSSSGKSDGKSHGDNAGGNRKGRH